MKRKTTICTIVGAMLLLGATVWNLTFASGQQASQAASGVVGAQIGSDWSVNFSSLGSPISPLGPVAMTEADTAELSALNEAMGKLWREVRPASILPEQQAAVQELYTEEAEALYQFTLKYPASFWTPPIQARLGYYYRKHGGYSRALELFGAAWEATKSFEIAEVKEVADFSLSHYLGLLSRLGRFETMAALFEETAGRRFFTDSYGQLYLQAREAFLHMEMSPGTSYRCGTYALANAAAVEHASKRFFGDVRNIDSPAEGFSLLALQAVSEQFQMGFVPVTWNNAPQVVVPSVVHWKAGHYAAIVSAHEGWFMVKDPTFDGAPVFLTTQEILAEASGFFMVPANKVPANWTVLGPGQSSEVRGRGIYVSKVLDYADEPPTCENGEGGGGRNGGPPPFGCKDCRGGKGGMPEWRITEPFANVWLKDTPLFYQPALGGEMAVTLEHRQRGSELSANVPASSLSQIGNSWQFPWRSVVTFGVRAGDGSQTFTLYTPAGSSFTFTFSNTATVSTPNYFTHCKLERVIDSMTSELTSVVIHFPDGAKDVYGFSAVNSVGVSSRLLLTSRIDAFGNAVDVEYFTYNPANQKTIIKRVQDADGNYITFTYDTASGLTNNIVEIADHALRTAKLKIVSGLLTEITDAVNITNRITYNSSNWVQTVVTPYGTNSFDYVAVRDSVNHKEGRIVTVTEPQGGQQRLAYLQNDAGLPSMVDPMNSGTVTAPSGTPYNTFTVWTGDAHTYHWDARIFPNLSTNFKNDPANYFPTDNDRLRGRGRVWVGQLVDHGGAEFGPTLSAERDPSPDGTTLGQVTWFDHEGKQEYGTGEYNWQGTQIHPGVVARVMPDSTVWYKYTTYSAIGKPLEEIEKWVEGGSAKYRTNTYTYASNGIDLVEHRFKATGVNHLVAGYGYNSNHQVTLKTNALNEVFTTTFDGSGRMVTFQTPSGMVSSNSFGGDGYISKTVVYEAGVGPISTNEFVWQNNLLWKQLDARGLLVTNSWDGLLRPTKIEYPDGSYIKYAYTNGNGDMLLERTYARDRMGNETRWTYTAGQKVENAIDALGNITHNEYCVCGALESTTAAYGTALAEMTEYYHDFQSRLTAIDFPDLSWRTNAYDSLGRLTAQGDAFGSTTYYYDNLGRLVTSSNYFGQVLAMGYDAEGNVTSRTDANGVTVVSTYDDLHRVLTRTYPDTGVEQFYYAANAPAATIYTNQLGKVTTFTYDALGRKETETFSGTISNLFSYSPAGDLLTLTDGNGNVTTWKYNVEGRVAVKVFANNATNLTYLYDANGRITNRWSAAKGNTYYGYDAVGNLTAIDYPTSADVSISHDAHGRVTNEVVAGVFTSDYTYHPGGAVATEDGPFASDTLTYTYSGGLRAGLSIQQPTGSFTNGYFYDAAQRLTNVTSHAGTFSYAYKSANGGVTAPTRLIETLTLPNTSYIANTFDSNARRLRTTLKNSSNTELNDHEYVYNVGNQRTKHTRTDDSFNTYTYDNYGQLESVRTTNSLGAIIAENFGYGIDNGFNITIFTNNAVTSTYTVNNLNQNTTTYTYDLNGNPDTGYSGGRTYTFDDENRLTVTTAAGANKSEFFYDARSRLRKRLEYTWVSGAWGSPTETRYVYDGMLAVQERDGSNNPVVQYTRGSTLSGSLSGAGGIGGLLARSSSHNAGTFGTHVYYHADGNGNITYIQQANQTFGGSYKYDPFGNQLSSSGIYAVVNTYRFSSKERHSVTGLYYFGYRFFDPTSLRWVNRDPLGERGGLNIYSFVYNNPVIKIDPNGLFPYAQISPPDCAPVGCNQAVGASVLLQLRKNGIDGTDDAGGGNAFRHCLAACQSSKQCGEKSAREFWDGRENPDSEAGQQDLANNKVGYDNAKKSSCWDACMASWNNGGLTCGNGPCPPREPAQPDPPSPTPEIPAIVPF